MSARTKDERINEKADEIYELLKEWATTHVCPNYRTGECDCKACRSDRLMKWVEDGRSDDKCDLCGSDLDEAGEYCQNPKCKNSPFEQPTVICSVCHNRCSGNTAHRHQGAWIGDECCWDERLRASE